MFFPMLFCVFLGALSISAQATCGTPEKLPNAMSSPQKTSFDVDDVVTYTCEMGYVLSSKSTSKKVTCLNNGKWSEAQFSCDRRQCSAPKDIDHASFNGNSSFGDAVTYQCEPGYRFTGSIERIVCQADGTWSPLEPSDCEAVSCPAIVPTSNLEFDPHDTVAYEERVEYSCTNGLALVGDSYQICMEDGSWSGSQPTCKDVKCKKPEWNIINGQAMGSPKEQYKYKESVQYACIDKYVPQPKEISCTDNNEWSATVTCIFTGCRTPPSIDKGHVVKPHKSEYAIGDFVSYKCHQGNRLNGSERVYCNQENQWSRPPTCETVECGGPPTVIVNGRIQPTVEARYHPGNKVLYSCDHGYHMQGNREITCQINGEWSALPSCLLIPPAPTGAPTTKPRKCECGHPPNIDHGSFQPHKTVYTCGEKVIYSCKGISQVDGNKENTCEINGRWSVLLAPTCRTSSWPIVVIVLSIILIIIAILVLFFYKKKKFCFATGARKIISEPGRTEHDVPLNDKTVQA